MSAIERLSHELPWHIFVSLKSASSSFSSAGGLQVPMHTPTHFLSIILLLISNVFNDVQDGMNGCDPFKYTLSFFDSTDFSNQVVLLTSGVGESLLSDTEM